MLLATLALLPPALARLMGEADPRFFLAAACLFPLIGAIHDRVATGRVHFLYWFAWLFPLVPQPLGSAIEGLDLWRRFANWLV
jgi:hypothetical protein